MSDPKKKGGTLPRSIYKVDEKESPFIITEAFRNLMTNVGFAIPKKEEGKGKVVCVSSSIASEGKTTVSVNLALTCAGSGAKTVLVDCDLRKPHVRAYFDIGEKEGIISYLSGQATLEEVTVKDVVPGLDVIAGKQSAPNPIVLLNDESFGKMIEKLESEYDYVIVDTSPVGIVSDATIIGQKTDGVILVTRQMYSNHRALREVLRQFDFAGCRVLGFVLNDFSVSRGKYYGSKYGYKYGYSKYGYPKYGAETAAQTEKKE